ncbi:DNA binding protein [[Candida] boidinii]|nr:DNA binding protein [[Candida] boidinii]
MSVHFEEDNLVGQPEQNQTKDTTERQGSSMGDEEQTTSETDPKVSIANDSDIKEENLQNKETVSDSTGDLVTENNKPLQTEEMLQEHIVNVIAEKKDTNLNTSKPIPAGNELQNPTSNDTSLNDQSNILDKTLESLGNEFGLSNKDHENEHLNSEERSAQKNNDINKIQSDDVNEQLNKIDMDVDMDSTSHIGITDEEFERRIQEVMSTANPSDSTSNKHNEKDEQENPQKTKEKSIEINENIENSHPDNASNDESKQGTNEQKGNHIDNVISEEMQMELDKIESRDYLENNNNNNEESNKNFDIERVITKDDKQTIDHEQNQQSILSQLDDIEKMTQTAQDEEVSNNKVSVQAATELEPVKEKQLADPKVSDVSTVEEPESENVIEEKKQEMYNGISIPSDSSLLTDVTKSEALAEYKKLINGSARINTDIILNAQLSALPLAFSAPQYLPFDVQFLINTLPVLDNLSTQILRILAQGPYQKIMEMVTNTDTFTGKAFENLIKIFEDTKVHYGSQTNPFFTVENITGGLWKFGADPPSFLKGLEDTVEGTLRKINLSTFLLATLGLVDLGFFFLNEAFLDVFCPPQNLDPAQSMSELENLDSVSSAASFVDSDRFKLALTSRSSTKFLKSQAVLYLELKTQAYISAIELGDRAKEEIIQDLFPDNLGEILIRRRDPNFNPNNPLKKKISRNSTMFTPAELDFLSRCDSRKKTLISYSTESGLMEAYEWVKFLNDLLEYVSKNVGFLIWGPRGRVSHELARYKRSNTAESLGDVEEQTGIKKLKTNGGTPFTTATLESNSSSTTSDVKNSDSDNSANENGNSGKKDHSNRKSGESKVKVKTETPEAEEFNYYGNSKSSKTNRQNRPSAFRRTWSEEEEDALREGLKLRDTHWTAILELFGAGGKISEALKNRNPLQLKDKARNWKLHYLRNSLELPSYLKNVTGDLSNEDKLRRDASLNLRRPNSGKP